jgi:drug/metabolite transporter (DMT)-like permease
MQLILIMMLVSGMLAGGQILLKTGLNAIGGFPGLTFSGMMKLFSNPFVLGGVAMIGSQMLIWMWVLARYDLTRAYPLISMSYVFGAIFAMVFLREHPGAMRLVGTFLIVVGVAMVSKL